MIEALEPLMLAAGDGLAVLIVAHQRKAAGKHGEAVRGSNAITGGVDVIVELERAPEELGRRMRVLRAESRFTATSTEQLAEASDIAAATLKHKLKTAFENGFISREGTGRKGDPYRWHPRVVGLIEGSSGVEGVT